MKDFQQFQQLTDTEEYLQFFDIAYDQNFVNVNRLHILKQFSLLLQEIEQVYANLNETERLAKYGEAFTEAYELFQTSSPLETKLFKVFNDKPNNVVFLEDILHEPANS